jgi:hypothetical protein
MKKIASKIISKTLAYSKICITFAENYLLLIIQNMEQLQRVQQAKQVQTRRYEGKRPEFIAQFEKCLATGITAEELIERMNKRIDAWPWKDR